MEKRKDFQKKKTRDKESAAKPVSLAPLSFEKALKGLVRVKPAKKTGA
jgi:hypothetical protein